MALTHLHRIFSNTLLSTFETKYEYWTNNPNCCKYYLQRYCSNIYFKKISVYKQLLFLRL